MAKLTAKQERFVDEYLIDLNATQAAIRAGYSEKTAYSMGQRLLKNVEVQLSLQDAIKQREQRTAITQDRVLKELEKVGFADAADYADATLKYSNKLRALELIGKHLGLFDGKGAPAQGNENNLLDAIAQSAGEELETDDISEIE